MKLKAVSFGEILWDIFPNYKVIGGAPLNLILRMKSFGHDCNIISSVGNDKNGNDILKYLSINKISIDTISVSRKYPTGLVDIKFEDKSDVKYSITYPVAWDFIQNSYLLEKLVKNCDLFFFGSLSSRSETSANCLNKLLEIAKYKIFDVNLRPPHFKIESIIRMMNKSNFIKFNEEEINLICHELGCKSKTIEDMITFISSYSKTKNICVSRGSQGAILYTNDKYYYNKGFKVKTKDTVGSGDSFLAMLISELKKGVSPIQSLTRACAIGAIVSTREGANPRIGMNYLNDFLKKSVIP